MPEEWAILEFQRKTCNSQAEAQTEGRDQVLKNGEFSGGTASPTLQLLKALKKWEQNPLRQSTQFLQGIQAFSSDTEPNEHLVLHLQREEPRGLQRFFTTNVPGTIQHLCHF